MAEFAAGARRFAVEMEMRVADGENVGGVGKFADQIQHGGRSDRVRRAERQTHDGAQMVLELTGERAFDGPVAGVVDARRHFVGEQAAILFEKFDGEDADVLELVENAARGFFGGALDGGIESRRGSQGEAEDAASMVVLDQGIDGGFAGAGADGEDAKFAGERNEAFEDEWGLASTR